MVTSLQAELRQAQDVTAASARQLDVMSQENTQLRAQLQQSVTHRQVFPLPPQVCQLMLLTYLAYLIGTTTMSYVVCMAPIDSGMMPACVPCYKEDGVPCCRDKVEAQLADMTEQMHQAEAALKTAQIDLHDVTEDR